MKIFYAIQATGNGHISRAMELLPHLEQYGSVDIFLSGANSSLSLDAPIKYRSKGLSLFYNCSGGLDYWKMMKEYQPFKLKKEIQDLPVEKYDLVINDFEYITAASCTKKKIPSVQFGHQGSFQSGNTPRPSSKSSVGEWVLKNYARATHHIGLHFEKYDDFIFQPVIKKQILEAASMDKNYITVYLPSYCEPQLEAIFHPFKEFNFQIFSRETRVPKTRKNIQFLPVDTAFFNQSLIHCSGIITGGGFETPAEAIHLGKKIISIPIRGQYEQVCNAAALEKLGVTCLKTIDENFSSEFYHWIEDKKPLRIDYSKTIPESLDFLFSLHEKMKSENAELILE
ncbi:MAG TPA: glycosyltransferase family protein [Chitinophagaceae bacterium]|nr:glycosyltransferase family protein [Chitinophagaceae bacterium]